MTKNTIINLQYQNTIIRIQSLNPDPAEAQKVNQHAISEHKIQKKKIENQDKDIQHLATELEKAKRNHENEAPQL